jgi:hypothetical protein
VRCVVVICIFDVLLSCVFRILQSYGCDFRCGAVSVESEEAGKGLEELP